MKGIIFTELLDFVESHAGVTGLEEVLEAAGLQGVYSATGNYAHQQAIDIVVAASKQVGVDAGELMRLYGRDLFDRLRLRYPMFFEDKTDSFSFLSGIQTHIHDEVKVLYPDTTPPEFEVTRTEDSIEIRYLSHRPFAVIAHGMIEACIEHFGEDLLVRTLEPISVNHTQAVFIVSPK